MQRIPEALRGRKVQCVRCGTRYRRFDPSSRARTLALALAALALYAPANIYPVMVMDLMGRHSENAVWTGVVSLCQDGMYFIAGNRVCCEHPDSCVETSRTFLSGPGRRA